MPQAPKHPCPGKGPRRGMCPNLVGRGERACVECMPYVKQDIRRYDRERDQGESRQWIHSARWRKASRAHLCEHPLCAECERQGKVTAATLVDHIKPHKGNYELFWDPNNWQSMCDPCHNRKTATEDGGFGNKPIESTR